MKYTIVLILALLVSDSCLCANEPISNKDSLEVSSSSSGLAEQKPNIIFILVDDLGKEWIGCYGGQNIDTPNIDALAASGIKFNNVYSMPQCTPSRACFLTGQYPFRNGWVNHWDVPRWGVGYFDWAKNPSIARMMQSAGYRTAAAGKWQLNDFREHPDAMSRHGFDAYCMWTGGETDPNDAIHGEISDQRYWNPYIHTQDGSRTYPGEFGPDIYNQFLLNFITENKDRPFFIYYPMVLPHTPFTSTPLEPAAEGKMGRHRAMVRYIDHLVGQTVNHLEELGIRKNTLIVFTSDNGTVSSIRNQMNTRLVIGGKTKTTENGVNAPFIVNFPSLVLGGQTSNVLIDFTDMLPTFAELAVAQPEPGYIYDGLSAKEAFLGKDMQVARSWILAMGSKPAVATDRGIENAYYFRDRVLRESRFKLFVGADRTPEKLVDLANDPEEKNNLITNTEFSPIVARIMSVVESQPVRDNDPFYTVLEEYPHYETDGNLSVSAPKKSLVHKIGYKNQFPAASE